MSIEDYLTMTIEIWRRSLGTQNDYGEPTDLWSKVTTICGVIQPASGNLKRGDSGQIVTSSHTLFCLATCNIRVDDKVNYDSKFYNVLFVKDAAGRDHHYEVSLNVVE